jgi:Kef-type K+ transport system membrane component KefB
MTRLLVQLPVILLVTLLCGWAARKIGQARVVGEIVGGILLGPSLFGRFFPSAFAVFFPRWSMSALEVLSTVGLILFLFVVGAEVEIEHLYRHRTTALLASITSIVVPFVIAVALAPSLAARFAPPGVSMLVFTLFLGIAMSITALPVLARILEEQRLLTTSVGTTAVSCAAVNDVVAWLLLALTLALMRGNEGLATLPLRFGGLFVYLAVMLGVVRPVGAWLVRRRGELPMSLEIFGLTLVGVFLSAAATHAIGVHPLFGAFLAGVCLPRSVRWAASLRARLDTIVSVLLLPLFFAFTGLRTRVDMLNSGLIWAWTVLVVIAAVAGKVGGAAVAARSTGQSWSFGWALGVLLNTRGLVELIVLNIAYDAGAFSPTLFTMLVLMALATTVITTPLLARLPIENSVSKELAAAG